MSKVLTFGCGCEFKVRVDGSTVRFSPVQLCAVHNDHIPASFDLDPEPLARYVLFGGQRVKVRGPLEYYTNAPLVKLLRQVENEEIEFAPDEELPFQHAQEAYELAEKLADAREQARVIYTLMARIEAALSTLKRTNPDVATAFFGESERDNNEEDYIVGSPDWRSRRAAVRYLARLLAYANEEDAWSLRFVAFSVYGVMRTFWYLAALNDVVENILSDLDEGEQVTPEEVEERLTSM